MKHSKRLMKCVMAGALCVAMTMPVLADTKADVTNQINTLESQASDLESELSSMKANKTSLESYIAELDTKIKSTLSDLNTVSDEIEQTNEEITVAKKNLKKAEADQKTQYDALKARIKAIYESDEDASFFRVLLQDADLKSVLNSQEYKSRINMYDYDLYTNLEETTQKILDYEQELGEKQANLEKNKDTYQQQMDELNVILDERQSELSSLDESMQAAYSDISDIQSQIDAQNNKMSAILADEKKTAEERAAKEAAVKKASQSTTTKKEPSGSSSTKKETEAETKRLRQKHLKRKHLRRRHLKIIQSNSSSSWVEQFFHQVMGVVYGPTGKETYYNLDMSGVVSIMRNMGFSSEDYPYWVREDGCKMLGPYIMCAANLDRFPRGTTVESSLGTCLVCDTGGFAASNPTQLDIATNW